MPPNETQSFQQENSYSTGSDIYPIWMVGGVQKPRSMMELAELVSEQAPKIHTERRGMCQCPQIQKARKVEIPVPLGKLGG